MSDPLRCLTIRYCLTSFLLIGATACEGGGPSSDQPSGALTFTIGSLDTLRVDLEIGTVAGRPEETFGNVRDLEVAPDGSIYILDASVNAVRSSAPEASTFARWAVVARDRGSFANQRG